MVKFFIPILPVAKGRPRFAKRGNFVATYTPAKTLTFEKIVAVHGRTHIAKPLECAIRLDLVFAMPIPASTSKKRAIELLNSPHTKRPDLDNLQKGVLDGLNGIAWLDDSQIYSIIASKIYSDSPGIAVTIIET